MFQFGKNLLFSREKQDYLIRQDLKPESGRKLKNSGEKFGVLLLPSRGKSPDASRHENGFWAKIFALFDKKRVQ